MRLPNPRLLVAALVLAGLVAAPLVVAQVAGSDAPDRPADRAADPERPPRDAAPEARRPGPRGDCTQELARHAAPDGGVVIETLVWCIERLHEDDASRDAPHDGPARDARARHAPQHGAPPRPHRGPPGLHVALATEDARRPLPNGAHVRANATGDLLVQAPVNATLALVALAGDDVAASFEGVATRDAPFALPLARLASEAPEWDTLLAMASFPDGKTTRFVLAKGP